MGSDLITIHRERVVPTDGHGEQQGVACQGLTIECLRKMTHHCHPCPKCARADRLPARLGPVDWLPWLPGTFDNPTNGAAGSV